MSDTILDTFDSGGDIESEILAITADDLRDEPEWVLGKIGQAASCIGELREHIEEFTMCAMELADIVMEFDHDMSGRFGDFGRMLRKALIRGITLGGDDA